MTRTGYSGASLCTGFADGNTKILSLSGDPELASSASILKPFVDLMFDPGYRTTA